ncbi:MAG: peptide-methionine (S)-S-oxide reductase MsrA, partial [Magnetospiraceae bacterium]
MLKTKYLLPVVVPTVLVAVLVGFLSMNGAGARDQKTQVFVPGPALQGLSVATFAGGCFWCVEAAFEKVPGVKEAISGYTGGQMPGPSYYEVSSGGTGHTEAVQVYYDPSVISYEGLLEALWRTGNPTDSKGQYVDRGSQYRPGIFYHDAAQKMAAEKAVKELEASGRYPDPITIEITPASLFYAAEDYHQDYYKKNPLRYNVYTFNSGRYQFVESIWGEDTDVDWMRYRPQANAGMA